MIHESKEQTDSLARRMTDLHAKKGIFLKYRSLQTLQLTELQLRVLEAITPEKIADATLLELAKAFKILKDAELGLKGEPFRITGLLGYLLELEKDEKDQYAGPEEILSG